MKKRLLTLCMVALSATTCFAQLSAKVSTQSAFDYNRCSITVLTLGGTHESITDQWTNGQSFGGKFDVNKVNFLRVSGSDAQSIQEYLSSKGTGKQILNYWVGYDGTNFDSKLMEERSRYNATDADVLADKAQKVSTLFTSGKGLINNSYVMVAGPTEVKRQTDKKGNVSYSAKASAYVYHVNLNDSILTMVWDNWLDSESSADEHAQAKRFYDNLDIDLDFAAAVSKSASGKTQEEAVYSALNELLGPLEKQIDKWQVVTTIYSRHPLGAKIGLKEGLKNSDRYRAYKVVEDAEGNLRYKKMGFLRATKVVDNASNATGESLCSYFYQISGRNVKEGMFLKQQKDAKMSLALSYNLDAYNRYNLDYDLLMHTSRTLGTMSYFGLNFGFDTRGDCDCGCDASYFNIGFNYGYGIHPVRILEITPSIGIGGDLYLGGESSGDDEGQLTKKIGYYARGGLKVGLQIWYPVQVFVRADYGVFLGAGEEYVECENRFGQLTFGGGLRINF